MAAASLVAQRLSPRYVARVVQADTRADVLTLSFPRPLTGGLDLQIFKRLTEAQDWLRGCQVANRPDQAKFA